MSAYNWLNSKIVCPNCKNITKVKIQFHMASSFDGDENGRFHDNYYEIGQPIRWWPITDPRYLSWTDTINNTIHDLHDDITEYCVIICPCCGVELYTIIKFEQVCAISISKIGRIDVTH